MASKRDEKSLNERKNYLPAMGRSLTREEEGASVAEVAASLPACLLGAMEELKSSENLKRRKKRRKILVSLKIQREVILSLFSPIGLL